MVFQTKTYLRSSMYCATLLRKELDFHISSEESFEFFSVIMYASIVLVIAND